MPVAFKDTIEKYFELNDDLQLVYTNIGDGVAPYKNDDALSVRVVNYETFHNSLPATFKNGKKICDLIVYTENEKKYFSLNELTNTDPLYTIDFTRANGVAAQGKRNKAILQLYTVLYLLSAVPSINAFIGTFATKRCLFFNKQAVAPAVAGGVVITAPSSFGRVNTISEEGFEMGFQPIEGLGFKLFEYSGGKAAKIA